jgi:hypothetical protein
MFKKCVSHVFRGSVVKFNPQRGCVVFDYLIYCVVPAGLRDDR